MIPGETILSGANPNCYDCGKPVKWDVMRSPAGYYIGTYCNNRACEARGEPHSRESDYFRTREEAEKELEHWEAGEEKAAARSSGHVPGPVTVTRVT